MGCVLDLSHQLIVRVEVGEDSFKYLMAGSHFPDSAVLCWPLKASISAYLSQFWPDPTIEEICFLPVLSITEPHIQVATCSWKSWASLQSSDPGLAETTTPKLVMTATSASKSLKVMAAERVFWALSKSQVMNIADHEGSTWSRAALTSRLLSR